MISVIVPTMWRYMAFWEFMNIIVQNPHVGEVIVINNMVEATPDLEILKHRKIKMLNQEDNIFINPAWNLGAEQAACEKLCFINDDVIVDPTVFAKVEEFLECNYNLAGVVGISTGHVEHGLPPIRDGKIKIIPYVNYNYYKSWWGLGTLFFLNKDEWRTIPEEIKVFYGDQFIWDKNIKEGRMNYLIVDCFYYSPMNQTIGNSDVCENVGRGSCTDDAGWEKIKDSI